jgi:hypothetical protein
MNSLPPSERKMVIDWSAPSEKLTIKVVGHQKEKWLNE